MNRANDLLNTLHNNIYDNRDYLKLKHLVCDFSSTDGLYEGLFRDYRSDLDSGRLVYRRFEGFTHWLPSVCHNICLTALKADIVLKVDADNYTGKGFAKRFAGLTSETLALPETAFDHQFSLRGRFGIWQNQFIKLGGYTPLLDAEYGWDDYEFVFRAILSGLKVVFFPKSHIERRIENPFAQKVMFMKSKRMDVNLRLLEQLFTKGWLGTI